MLNRLANIATIVAALAVAGLAFDRLRPGPASAPGAVNIDDWRAHADTAGVWLGRRDAPVVLVEFMDAQCPFCARLVPVVDSLRAEFGDSLAVVVVHWPLGFHDHAQAAAVAWECAGEQGRFAELMRETYARQAEVGTVAWQELADRAGVPDLTLFSTCMVKPAEAFPRVVAGPAIAGLTGARGTPTVWVNGRKVQHASGALRETIRAQLSGRGD